MKTQKDGVGSLVFSVVQPVAPFLAYWLVPYAIAGTAFGVVMAVAIIAGFIAEFLF